MYCKQCGKQISEDAVVCLKCGTKNDVKISTKPIDPSMSQREQIKKTGFRSIISVVIPIIIIIGIAVFTNFGDKSEDTNSDSNLTSVGDYYCSDEDATYADTLFTNFDYTNDIVELDALWYELENMYVDEYSQESIDAYNIKVDTYNEKSDALDARIIASEGSIEEHDNKIDEYNNYLETNCDKE
ncbi:MAG: zinc ribbon domain-containing protein [Candidatus Kerfeldbacteria bacterium]|jgi:peptidoglycan hydrolase CwlO-like protein